VGALLDLIRGLSKGWVALLDFDTLEKVSGSYVSDDLRDREDDISWRIRMHSTTSEGGWQQQGEWVDIWRSKATWMPSCGAHAHYVSPLYPDLIKTKRKPVKPPSFHRCPRWGGFA